MISYIKGTVTYKSQNFIILENNGIGYNIQISGNTLNSLASIDDTVKVYTYMNVKENEITLFGFLSMEELDIFNKLISVSGVGPKSALSILSIMKPSEVVLAIITDDIQTLCKGNGIGKKASQRIVLELKDKVQAIEYSENSLNIAENIKSDMFQGGSQKQDAIEALISLGFGRSQAVKAVIEIDDNNLLSSDIIKIALKKMSVK